MLLSMRSRGIGRPVGVNKTTEIALSRSSPEPLYRQLAAYLEGEYGINGLYVGVPCKLGARGLEQIIEINLTAEERIALQKSASAVQELVDVLGI